MFCTAHSAIVYTTLHDLPHSWVHSIIVHGVKIRGRRHTSILQRPLSLVKGSRVRNSVVETDLVAHLCFAQFPRNSFHIGDVGIPSKKTPCLLQHVQRVLIRFS
ncbi:hypothetical protein TraAM80_07406 [Trypanosoma rangeli]|uniref:Uncharacterized protein n=1 Tax=Trypanosoma rangeli TaxID=5698 RepID=A0A3R7NCV7_TRYRA|nr:uncharacterized protein TraAM80_07406 [Trypanosoma rangeli]RNF00782.1 hypothetical protein TraAM80_07406 [Trypanosoma rangeli]|eukprot:RNF00782.1 hypothetical protein TraAM80_07406 [Trypanosoma rangeli]